MRQTTDFLKLQQASAPNASNTTGITSVCLNTPYAHNIGLSPLRTPASQKTIQHRRRSFPTLVFTDPSHSPNTDSQTSPNSYCPHRIAVRRLGCGHLPRTPGFVHCFRTPPARRLLLCQDLVGVRGRHGGHPEHRFRGSRGFNGCALRRSFVGAAILAWTPPYSEGSDASESLGRQRPGAATSPECGGELLCGSRTPELKLRRYTEVSPREFCYRTWNCFSKGFSNCSCLGNLGGRMRNPTMKETRKASLEGRRHLPLRHRINSLNY